MTFSSIPTLMSKNLKIFFRSKFASLVVILLPLAIILFAGYGFSSNNFSGIVVGINSDSSNNLTENLINNFEENGFLTRNYGNLEDCISSVKLSEIQICVYFPENLSYSVNSENIIFYADHSRTNLVYILINIISEDVYSESSDFGSLLVQNLIDNIVETKNSLQKLKEDLNLVSVDTDNLRDLIEENDNPSGKLVLVISSLESYENSSEIFSEIDSLKKINQEISQSFEGLEEVDLEVNSLAHKIDDALFSLDGILVKLNSISLNDPEGIVSPINVEVDSVVPEKNKRDFLIPSIISLISLFGAIMISSTLVLKNKKTKAYFRNFVTPTRDITFVISTFLTCLVILILQFVFVFIGLYFVFNMNFFTFPFEIVSILLLAWGVFIFIGMFLGYFFKSEETIIFSSVLFSSFLMFFSNLILPLENISESLFNFAKFNPFVIIENSLKKIYIFELDFNSLSGEFVILGGLLLVFGFLTWITLKITKRRL